MDKNSTLLIEGNVDFVNDEENLTKVFSKDGSGSVIFNRNTYDISNLIFENLSKPFLVSHILYGGVNFIDSKVNLKNIYVINSKNEDGINIINSDSEVSNIYFENIQADAFDVDFGSLIFKNIDCKNIKNDCLDISGATVNGENLLSNNTFDKGISVGENSDVKITNLKTLNTNIGLAVKDGSKANLKNVDFDKNNLDIVFFNKKKEFSKPSLIINGLSKIDMKKILQSEGTKLVINNKDYFGNLKDEFINSKIY